MIQPVFGFSNQLSILYTKKNPKISRNCDCMNLIVDLLGSATKIHLTSKANISTFPESGCITSSTRPKGLPGAKRESNSKKPCCANQMSRARWVAQPIGRLLGGRKWKTGKERSCVNRLQIKSSNEVGMAKRCDASAKLRTKRSTTRWNLKDKREDREREWLKRYSLDPGSLRSETVSEKKRREQEKLKKEKERETDRNTHRNTRKDNQPSLFLHSPVKINSWVK